MKKATENQGSGTRTEFFSPSSKVKELGFQHHYPAKASVHQETPMRPSQIPYQLSYPPPRRSLPLGSPEPYYRDRLGPQWHPHHPSGPMQSSGNVPVSLPSISSFRNGPPVNPVVRLGPVKLSTEPPVHVPFHPNNIGISAHSLQPVPKLGPNGSLQLVPRAINPAPPSHIRTNQVTDSSFTPSNFGPKNSTAQRQESNESKQPPSSDRLYPAVDVNCSSQKRHGEAEYSSENAKKPCPQGTVSASMQPAMPAVGCLPVTCLYSSPVRKNSSVSELSPKTVDCLLHTEPAGGQSAYLEMTSQLKATQSCIPPSTPKDFASIPPSPGTKQPFIKSPQDQIVELNEQRSPPKPGIESIRKSSQESDKSDKSSNDSKMDTVGTAHAELSRCDTGHSASFTPAMPFKSPGNGNPLENNTKLNNSTPKLTLKPNSGSQSCQRVDWNKASCTRRSVPDDSDDLFTPDFMTCTVSLENKILMPRVGEVVKIPSAEKDGLSSSAPSSSLSSTGYSQTTKTTNSLHGMASSTPTMPIKLPTIILERVSLDEFLSSKEKKLKISPITSSRKQLKDVGCDDKRKISSNVGLNGLKTDAAVFERTSKSVSKSAVLQKQTNEWSKEQVDVEEPIDEELDLSLALDVDLTQSSHNSDEEQLLSLQEMMEHVTSPPDTPKKRALSQPPGHHSGQSKTKPLPSTKSGIYKNDLDQMLKEMNKSREVNELQTQLLKACKEELLNLTEIEEVKETHEEAISSKHQEFLQRYSLMSSVIREVPPGEAVFNLEKFGQIFNQDTLQLRQCMVNPQTTAQKTLLWSSPAQLRLHVTIGLFQEAYGSGSPCPAPVSRFLFKMMAVHSERVISEKMLEALCGIARTAAYQIVKNASQQFKVWVPNLADVTLVLMNIGVPFVTLFPFEDLQPSFTEGDLLEDIYIKDGSPSRVVEEIPFPEHNCTCIMKYLSYCMSLCPCAYSDDELLLLLTVVGRIGLETRLIFKTTVDLRQLQHTIVKNIRDWDSMLSRICWALTGLTDDHHNMCLIVQLLPDSPRGRQLCRHLSLCMISKLLDGNCTYKPTQTEFQLSDLRPYLPRMQPSTLLRAMQNSADRKQTTSEEDLAVLDEQAYYLCYSLLTLVNEASNYPVYSPHQKPQLLRLSAELVTHVKCHIRDSEKCLYRTKLKDLVARIYTKWQMLLQRTRPLNGKLYDYWEPVGRLTNSTGDLEDEDEEAEEGSITEEDEVEICNDTEETDAVMETEDGDLKVMLDTAPQTEVAEPDNGEPLRTEEETPLSDASVTTAPKNQLPDAVNEVMLGTDPQIDGAERADGHLLRGEEESPLNDTRSGLKAILGTETQTDDVQVIITKQSLLNDTSITVTAKNPLPGDFNKDMLGTKPQMEDKQKDERMPVRTEEDCPLSDAKSTTAQSDPLAGDDKVMLGTAPQTQDVQKDEGEQVRTEEDGALNYMSCTIPEGDPLWGDINEVVLQTDP
ncbi:SMC5-SMC6 complex localization factor protein 2 isoform 2-T2 [Pholidichthys leucotaenia]